MSKHTKKHPISAHAQGSTLHVTHHNKTYAIPKKVAEQYVVPDKKRKSSKSVVPIKKIFEKLEQKFTKAGALLKGLRLREGLSQVQFAKKIHVSQAKCEVNNWRFAVKLFTTKLYVISRQHTLLFQIFMLIKTAA